MKTFTHSPSRLALQAAAVSLMLAAISGLVPAQAQDIVVDAALPAYQPQPVAPPKTDAMCAMSPPTAASRSSAPIMRVSSSKVQMRCSCKRHPGVRFNLDGLKGTTTAMPALTHGTTPFGPMGRGYNRVELTPFKKIVGRAPVEIRVAHTATDTSAHLHRAGDLRQQSQSADATDDGTGQTHFHHRQPRRQSVALGPARLDR